MPDLRVYEVTVEVDPAVTHVREGESLETATRVRVKGERMEARIPFVGEVATRVRAKGERMPQRIAAIAEVPTRVRLKGEPLL